jgi:hypothetical protein
MVRLPYTVDCCVRRVWLKNLGLGLMRSFSRFLSASAFYSFFFSSSARAASSFFACFCAAYPDIFSAVSLRRWLGLGLA